jgi:hypothetical protein
MLPSSGHSHWAQELNLVQTLPAGVARASFPESPLGLVPSWNPPEVSTVLVLGSQSTSTELLELNLVQILLAPTTWLWAVNSRKQQKRCCRGSPEEKSQKGSTGTKFVLQMLQGAPHGFTNLLGND